MSEEFEIEVIDDTPPEDRGRTPLPPEPEPEGAPQPLPEEALSEGVQRRINELTRRHHDERRAREAAARERDIAAQNWEAARVENERLRRVLEEGQKAYAGVAENNIVSKRDQAEAMLRHAREAGDTEAEIKAQRLMGEAAADAARLEVYRTTVQAPTQVAPQAPTQVAPQAPARDTALDDWVSRNQWFNQDAVATGHAMGVHHQLVQQGVAPSSNEYYAQIDAAMKKYFNAGSQAAAAPPTSPVAPVTRQTAAAPRKVTLTQSELNLCNRLRISPEAYAAEKLRAKP
jgi:hypothetical protein